MATQLNPVGWQKTLSLERRPVFIDISNKPSTLQYQKNDFSTLVLNQQSHNTSFLHSQKLKQSLFESKKAFLNLSFNDDKQEEVQMEEKSIVLGQDEHRRMPSKKISFKIKKTCSIYRRNGGGGGGPQQQKMTISANTVAELTKKFNQIIVENKGILDEPQFKKLVKRVNSQKGMDNDKVSRRPSFKARDGLKVGRRPSLKTKASFNDKNLVFVKSKSQVQSKKNVKPIRTNISENKLCVRAKIGYLESPHVVPQPEEKPIRPTHLDLVKPPSLKSVNNNGTVRATIEIFERKTSLSTPETQGLSPKLMPKPKVPEKKFTMSNKRIVSKPMEPNKAVDIVNIYVSKPVFGDTEEKTDFDDDEVQIITIPAVLPQRRCDSMYETLNLRKISPHSLKAKSEETITSKVDNDLKGNPIKPNNSFLWRINQQDKSPSAAYRPVAALLEQELIDCGTIIEKEIPPKLSSLCSLNSDSNDWELIYDSVEVKACELKVPTTTTALVPKIPPRPIVNVPLPQPLKKHLPFTEEKIYEEMHKEADDYEYCESSKYEDVIPKVFDDGYEFFESPTKEENIYETLPISAVPSRRQQQEPLPPRPPSRSSYYTLQNGDENVSNCYESIYNPVTNVKKYVDMESTYESIYGCHIRESGSNRDSLVSSDQQSNSLYGRWCENGIYNGKATSDLSSSDRSDEWIDVTDNEEGNHKNSGIIIVREKQKSRKSGWSQHFRDQWSKSPRKFPQDAGANSDSDHHYESLFINNNEHDDDYDSFDSDTESEQSFNKGNLNDSGVDIANSQLPEPPNNQVYVLTRIAATAGKHMRKLRRNWSLTKNDISKSLSRMTKRKSRTDLDSAGPTIPPRNNVVEITVSSPSDATDTSIIKTAPLSYQNVEFRQQESMTDGEKSKTLPKKGFLNKFRRSMSMTAESASELTTTLGSKPKSTFYLTETIDVDEIEMADEASPDSGVSLSPVPRHSKSLTRPQSPPPPAPAPQVEPRKPNRKDRRASSWYAEAGLFKNSENLTPSTPKRPNTFWYAEVGLYQTTQSTPSTSSAENSGNTTSVNVRNSDYINQDNSEEYYNMRNSGDNNDYYNESINSFSSQETKKDESLSNLSQENQLRLQDEPLYQFYDAAVLESVCYDGTSEFDSDGYEEVGNKRLSSRPSAMELVSPKRNSICFNRTLWCEIPEVIQSAVLSTLSGHQKKLQEAKFEVITSEASYLNSLNVLNDHFVANLHSCECITPDEFDILFSKIDSVRDCSEKLLQDLERCWQDNILLHGVCDIIQQHAEDNFHVYVDYCENQILLDETLKRIKERPGFIDTLRQLESGAACQSLTLYSFLMLPMQRITRWPLLVDAVLKRLCEQDIEFVTCQYALATLNKIVSQCNEGARTKERENEMRKIATQLEFSKGVQPIEIVSPNRWLIRSGVVTHMQQRTDETKLTFGKRFIKSPVHLFLFNDMLFVTKAKSDNIYTVIHYCPRNLVELNSTESVISLPIKDSQGRHLLFMTILENQNEKTVELLLSCNSESDRERWVEALSPPKSEDPDETLYECWDCPQVTAIHNYAASQPDELPVVRGDVINVLRKMADGWYHGERIRDGQTGWFPANYTVEVANPHVRARNLKQRYRLLAFSENYLKTK